MRIDKNYIVLLILGIAVLVWGLFIHKNDGEILIKKWIPLLIGNCIVIAIGISTALPFIKLNEERQSVNEIRHLLENQQDSYDEEIGYQISNYCNGNAVYAVFFI